MDPLYKESAKKFYQNAYQLGRTKSQSPKKDSTQVAVPQQTTLKKSESASGKMLSMSQIQRHEQGDHTFRNLLVFLLFAALVIFAIDLYKEIEQQKSQFQLKRKKCFQEYELNECMNAAEAIKAKCHQWQMCYKLDENMAVRLSHSAVRLLGKLVNVFLKETGWLGAILVVSLAIVMLTFIYKASRSAMTHQMTYKRE